MPRWDVEWSRRATAVLDRISLALQAQAEDIYSNVQPKAEEFGKKLGSNEAYITNFAEEVIRGSGGLVLSQILAGLAGPVREAAKMGVWELASSLHAATGEVKVINDLVGIQGKSFDTPQVLLVHKLGGMEDIPPGVVAILSPSGVDVLSHIAIRARNQKVLLASCHDGGIFSALVDANKAHKYVKVAVDSTMQVSLEPAASAGAGVTGTKAPTSVKLAAADLGPSSSKYVMLDTAFAHGCLGLSLPPSPSHTLARSSIFFPLFSSPPPLCACCCSKTWYLQRCTCCFTSHDVPCGGGSEMGESLWRSGREWQQWRLLCEASRYDASQSRYAVLHSTWESVS